MENRLSNIRGAGIWGVGHAVPDRVLTNADLEEMVDTSDEWIVTRTGIKRRRIVAEDEATSDLAYEAALSAMERSGVDATDIDMVIVATVTPDMPFPATACLLADRLGTQHAAAFDVEAGCTGFVYALVIAAQMVAARAYNRVLVVGSETLTRITNWEDRSSCVLFGDAAGAAIVGPCSPGTGILSQVLGSDGSGGDVLKMPAGGSRMVASEETVRENLHTISMKGSEVFKFAVRAMADSASEAAARAGLRVEDIDCYIPHQANIRIIASSAKRLGIPMDKVFVNLEEYGNTSSASIPLALAEAWEQGRIKPGDDVLLVGFGAGLTWGATAIRWLDESDRILEGDR